LVCAVWFGLVCAVWFGLIWFGLCCMRVPRSVEFVYGINLNYINQILSNILN